jgi:hypothetical protein
MTFSVGIKDTREKLKQLEREELEDYCREQGFTKEQTELFVKNSLANAYPED